MTPGVTVTANIYAAGHATVDDDHTSGSSLAGHMDVTLTDSAGDSTPYGFAPIIQRSLSGPGSVSTTDRQHYVGDPDHTSTRTI